MTARFGSYDVMLANPPEYEGPTCPNCNTPMDFPMLCNRCNDLVDFMDSFPEIATLVKAAREHVHGRCSAADLLAATWPFPETGAAV